MSLIMSMAAFALATSITPGPVNVVALGSGARFGFAASQKHVAGAALGFTLLLVLIGLGLHELLVADDTTRKLIQERARVADLFTACITGGMRTLKMDGMEKVLMGLTDLKQVRAVCIK